MSAPTRAACLKTHLQHVGEHADLVLVAGDLTKCGTADEAKVFVEELADVPRARRRGARQPRLPRRRSPRSDRRPRGGRHHRARRRHAHRPRRRRRRSVSPAPKGSAAASRARARPRSANRRPRRTSSTPRRSPIDSQAALASLDTDVRIVLLHYAPVDATLEGERARSTRSSAATCWRKRSMPSAPTSCSTGMRTAARSTARPRRRSGTQRRPP